MVRSTGPLRFLVLLVGCGFSASARSDEPVDFNRDIRPILAKHCTACHGGVKAAADLSFVYGESAMGVIESGAPDDSELIRRVEAEDPEERMPPPDHGPALAAADIDRLRRWIQEGAAWNRPWALVLPKSPSVPAVRRTEWGTRPLDRFVLARMEANGLSPNPPASPAEWFRRVSFDLTGLPPSDEAWRRFLHEASHDLESAKARAVDRLLESPHYGERWAAMWLALARYADTFGFEKDPHRDIWPWRDWVIRAFNDDMPFDQFTIQQLAGDLLPDPGPDDLLATAFHRNTQNNTEGGTDDETFRIAAVIDRVNTTWTVWQATTFGCVQCHPHPYDPYPHRDYYRFLAIFNQTEDCDQNNDFPRTRAARDRSRQAEIVQREVRLRELRRALNEAALAVADHVADWETWTPEKAATTGGALRVAPSGRVDASGTLPVGVVYTLALPPRPFTALRIDLFPDHDDPTKWPERGSVLSQIEIRRVADDGKRKTLALREVVADALGGPYDPRESLRKGPAGFGGYPVLERPRWAVVLPEQPFAAADAKDTKAIEIVLRQQAASNSGTQAATLRHFRLSTSRDSRWSVLAADRDRRAKWRRWEQDRRELAAIPAVEVPVMWEREPRGRRTTRIFVRGSLLNKGEVVAPGLPEIFAVPVPENRPFNRLDLARWLVSDANPLAARVLANRLWAELFGRGIVETLEDFGSSGMRPTHPQLLDHLAIRLRGHHRWSVKRFLREIVLSATYGQTASAAPEKWAADPSNRWLARGPRQRLTAEMVRDQALRVSGKLSPALFGKPVYPPQPPGIWKTVYSGAKWETSKGAQRYRRAIYTYWRRTAGYPSLLLFDAPTRDVCTARRVPTNTPLQALVGLNDPAYFELAEALAEAMDRHGGTLDAQVEFAYRRLTGRAPTDTVVAALWKLYRDARRVYSEEAKLVPPGASPERAALVLVANTLLNLDVALMR